MVYYMLCPIHCRCVYLACSVHGTVTQPTDYQVAVQLLELAKDSANKIIMCVGHNRGWQEAASSYTRMPIQLGTSSAALMEIDAPTWEEALADDSIWELVGIVTPQEGMQVYNGVSVSS